MPATTLDSPRTAQLAEKIRQRILSEQLVDGDVFMTEAQLAAEYGVSRNMTRDAVSQLRGLGLLEGRKRVGLVVRRPKVVQILSHSLPALAQSEEDLTELATLRYVLEVGAIELCVRKATTEQIAQLKQFASEYEQVVKNGEGNARENECELAFHGLILQMTGSTLVSGMQQTLAQFFSKYYPDSESNATAHDIWEHHAIAAAIEARDAERARVLIRLHFKSILEPEKLRANSGNSKKS
jgi:GntR family transcriptional repressor for pyruvate dehydrogenase complex